MSSIEHAIREQEVRLKQLYAERETLAMAGQARTYEETQNACAPSRFSPEWIRDVVAYHQPGVARVERISAVRLATENFLRTVIDNCPDCADRSEAIRLARTAMMTANASIVLDGKV